MASRPWVKRLIGEPRLWMWCPYQGGSSRQWLKSALGKIRPEWNRQAGRWEVARAHFRPLLLALADRFGVADVYVEFSSLEQCDKRCQEAKGDECECSCLGEHHAGGSLMNWLEVGENTLIRSGSRVLKHFVVHRI